jgi:hypothetical protein
MCTTEAIVPADVMGKSRAANMKVALNLCVVCAARDVDVVRRRRRGNARKWFHECDALERGAAMSYPYPEVDWSKVCAKWLVPLLVVAREEEKLREVFDLLICVIVRMVDGKSQAAGNHCDVPMIVWRNVRG